MRNFPTRLDHKIGHIKLCLCTETVSAADTFQAVDLGNFEVGFPVSDYQIRTKKLGGNKRKDFLLRAKAIVLTAEVAGKPAVQSKLLAVSLLIGVSAVGEKSQRVSLVPKLVQHSGDAVIQDSFALFNQPVVS